jgi:hypothetical protein
VCRCLSYKLFQKILLKISGLPDSIALLTVDSLFLSTQTTAANFVVDLWIYARITLGIEVGRPQIR